MTSQKSSERIEIGSDVIAQAGEKVGTVDYVIVHPPEMHVTDIVVGTGGLLGRDVVVPIDAVDRVEDGNVYLTSSGAALGQYPDYVETHYTQPDEDWTPVTGFEYPLQSTLWPGGTSYMQATSVTVNAPVGTVGLSEGMPVESSDGHKVGTIEALEADPSTNDVTAFIVKRGHLFKHDTRIPTSDVDAVHAARVTLKLSRDEVHLLEEDQGQG